MPLPKEDHEDDQEERDLIKDSRDVILAGRLERDSSLGEGVVVSNEGDDELTMPLTLEEILEDQRADEFCQTILTSPFGRNGMYFFENDSDVLCRHNHGSPTSYKLFCKVRCTIAFLDWRTIKCWQVTWGRQA